MASFFRYLALALFVFALIRLYKLQQFRDGSGERAASAEFHRIKREEPESNDAKKSEAEFIDKYMHEKKPSIFGVVSLVMLSFLSFYFSVYIAYTLAF